MGENKAVHAPYNFIPFAENPWLPYSSIDDLPPHDRIDPKRRTGELHITLTAETPVFVAGEKGGQPGGASHFFRTPDGAFAIPGSTIRGMTRANMQILSFAPMRLGEDIGNCHPLYREVASASKSTAGALKAYYHNALGVTARRSASGKACAVPENVRAGYIRCEKNGYAIYPTKGGKYFRVPRSASPEGEGYAKTSIVFYSTNGERVEEVRTTCWTDSALKGTLLYTGKAALKPNPLYLFPEEDVDGLPVPVPQEDVLSYKADWEKRKNGLRPASFWKLPEPGEPQNPSFISAMKVMCTLACRCFCALATNTPSRTVCRRSIMRSPGRQTDPWTIPAASSAFRGASWPIAPAFPSAISPPKRARGRVRRCA